MLRPGLFQGDPDFDKALEITHCLATEIIGVPKNHRWTDDPEFAWLDYFLFGVAYDMDAAAVRQHLDSGAGDELFRKFRAREDNRKIRGAESRHTVIVLGAMMMRVGAKIRAEDMAHLWRLSERSDAGEWLMDEGKLELQVALDNYRAGTRRTFGGPSCDNCGMTSLDTGKELHQCKECMSVSWADGWSCSKVCTHCPHQVASAHGYCVQECLRAHRNMHKQACQVQRARPIDCSICAGIQRTDPRAD